MAIEKLKQAGFKSDAIGSIGKDLESNGESIQGPLQMNRDQLAALSLSPLKA